MISRVWHLRILLVLSLINIAVEIINIVNYPILKIICGFFLTFSIIETILIGLAVYYANNNVQRSQKIMCCVGVNMFYIRELILLIPFTIILNNFNDWNDIIHKMDIEMMLFDILISNFSPNLMLVLTLLDATKTVRTKVQGDKDRVMLGLIGILTAAVLPVILTIYIVIYQIFWAVQYVFNNNIVELIVKLSLIPFFMYLIYLVSGLWNNKYATWIGRCCLLIAFIVIIYGLSYTPFVGNFITFLIRTFIANFINSVIFEDFISLLFVPPVEPDIPLIEATQMV